MNLLAGFHGILTSVISLRGGSLLKPWTHHVFGGNHLEPRPEVLLEHLQRQGFDVSGHFRGDGRGWFSVELTCTSSPAPLSMNRYLADEDGIRAELNSWAAYVETITSEREAAPLMQRLINARQIYVIEQPFQAIEAGEAVDFGSSLCRFLAETTEGIYYANGRGFFAPDGRMLIDDGI